MKKVINILKEQVMLVLHMMLVLYGWGGPVTRVRHRIINIAWVCGNGIVFSLAWIGIDFVFHPALLRAGLDELSIVLFMLFFGLLLPALFIWHYISSRPHTLVTINGNIYRSAVELPPYLFPNELGLAVFIGSDRSSASWYFIPKNWGVGNQAVSEEVILQMIPATHWVISWNSYDRREMLQSERELEVLWSLERSARVGWGINSQDNIIHALVNLGFLLIFGVVFIKLGETIAIDLVQPSNVINRVVFGCLAVFGFMGILACYQFGRKFYNGIRWRNTQEQTIEGFAEIYDMNMIILKVRTVQDDIRYFFMNYVYDKRQLVEAHPKEIFIMRYLSPGDVLIELRLKADSS